MHARPFHLARFEWKITLVVVLTFSLIRLVDYTSFDLQKPQEQLFLANQVTGVALMWVGGLWLTRLVRRLLPLLRQTAVRFLLSFLLCQVLAVLINQLQVQVANRIGDGSEVLTWDLFFRYSVNLIPIVLLMTGIYEALYQQALLRQAQCERNGLLRLQAEGRLNELKGRVNPHFLFNSLNTISSLMYRDPAAAERFVEELSVVYRSLLRQFDHNLTTLEGEIRFARSYALLLLIRFEDSLSVEFTIDEELSDLRLPPHCMQLLFDHIIRYNRMSREEPLQVRVRTKGRYLVVEHNRQARAQGPGSDESELSLMLGLFQQAGMPEADIHETPDFFKARLPLLEPAAETTSTREVRL